MGVKTLTINDIVNGVTDLIKDCIKYQTGPTKTLEINSAVQSAKMNAVIFNKHPKLYWDMKSCNMYISNKDSETYIEAYNIEARSLGIPEYHMTAEYLIGFIVFVVLYFVLMTGQSNKNTAET